MKCSDICKCLEQEYSKEYACSWDNVGLLVGRSEKEVKNIMLALDATDEVIQMAVERKIDMLITHHPMIFSAMKKINDQDFIGRRVLKLIQNDISYYAMHTNYDTRGMADLAANMLHLQELTVLEEIKDGEGIGRIGKLPQEMTLKACAEFVKETYQIPSVKYFGDPDMHVYLAAICPGSGKSNVSDALRAGCQVYITGDIDHHTGIDAVAQGLAIIDAGHYGIEHIFMQDVRNYLEKTLIGVHMECVPVEHPFHVI